ncbi:hypothetical protein TKK_0003910 [Trichogramma kaykai]
MPTATPNVQVNHAFARATRNERRAERYCYWLESRKKKKASHIEPQLTVDDIRSRLRHRVKKPSEQVQVSTSSDLKNCAAQTPDFTCDDATSEIDKLRIQPVQVSVPSDLKNCVMQTTGSLCDNEASAIDKINVPQVSVNLFSELPDTNVIAVSAVVAPPPCVQAPSKCREALHEEYLVKASVDNAVKQLERESLKLRAAQQRALMRPAEPLEDIFLPGLPISDATYQTWLQRAGDFRF